MGTWKINKGGTDYTAKGFKIRLGATEHTSKGFWIKVQGTWRWVGFLATPTNAYLESSGFSYASITWYNSGATDLGVDWATPIGGASGLYIKFVHNFYNSPGGSPVNTWLQMNTSRYLVLGHPSLKLRSEGDYYISTAGSDATIVGMGQWLLKVTQGLED